MDLQHTTLGKYKLEEQLGAGGMGAVFRSTHPQLNRPVAIKVILRTFSENSEVRQRFVREAQVVSQLSHPGIVRLFDIDETNGMLYLVMELVEGPSLADVLQEEELPLDRILTIGIELAEALHYAHEEGMMHRDLKPANVLIRPNGRAVLVDFGLARLVDGKGDNQLTSTGTVMGTVAYMSPEQLQAQHIDRRTDIYALGIMLYKMLTGRLPYEGDTAQMMFGHIYSAPAPLAQSGRPLPPALEQLVMAMIAKDRNQRPASGADVASHLRSIKASLSGPQQGFVSAPAGWNQPQAAQYQPAMPSQPLPGSNPPSQPFNGPPSQPFGPPSQPFNAPPSQPFNGPPSQPFGQGAQPYGGPPSQPFNAPPSRPYGGQATGPASYGPGSQPYGAYSAPGVKPGGTGFPVAFFVAISLFLLLAVGGYFAYSAVSGGGATPTTISQADPTEETEPTDEPAPTEESENPTEEPAPTEETEDPTEEPAPTEETGNQTTGGTQELTDKDGLPVTVVMPDGEKYVLSGVNRDTSEDGTTTWFRGAIKNEGDGQRLAVRVTVNLLDSQGNAIDYADGGIRSMVLSPGDTTGFEVIFSRKLPEYTALRLDVTNAPTNFIPFEFVPGLEISGDQLVDDFFPYVEGTIKNTSDKRVDQINVYVTVYDPEGYVIGLSLGTDLESDLLIPGAESTFKADILINGLDVANSSYSYIVEGQLAR